MGREAISCWNCGSTVRFRAVVRALSLALFGRDLPLPDFPRRSLRGLGLSDWEGYAASLEERLDYTNTFYHREPRLDIRRVDLARLGTLDFLVASDVFEHVPPPVSAAFENVWRLLKPGGAFVFTAPYAPEGETVEHFPRLYDYEIIREGGRSVLTNTTREGEAQRFEGLRFHGGSGESLEMRRFSRPSLLKAFHDAGFSAVTVLREPRYEHGIVWLEAHSFPIVARK
jgi:SAM-dependent methyltransferase